MLKKFFTPEMGINAVVTLGVVMGGLYLHEKYVSPRLSDSAPKGNGNGTASPSAPADNADEEA